MRVILVTAAALAALTLSGCDINTTPKTAKVECNCAAPPAPPAGMRGGDYNPPPAEPYREHHRWHGGSHHGYARWHGGEGGHSYYWRREYSEMSVFTYDYHSDSHSYETGGGHGGGGASAYAYAAAGAYAGGGAYAGAGAHTGGGAYAGDAAHGGDGYHVVDHGWVDGYGRGHGGGAYTSDPAHYETAPDDHARRSVWHGYDEDCPDPAARR